MFASHWAGLLQALAGHFAEQALIGQQATPVTFQTGGRKGTGHRQRIAGNRFKIELAKRTIVSVLTRTRRNRRRAHELL